MSAQQSRATGLDREQSLPSGFEAKSDTKAGKVEISRSGKGQRVKVDMSSYASVASLLSGLWPDGEASLEPGSALVIEESFSGRKATVVAAAIPDVAAVLKALVTKPGKYVPAKDEAKESAPAKGAQPAAAEKKTASKSKAASSKKATPASKGKAKPAAKAASAQAAAPKRSHGIPPMPEWMKAHKDREDADDGVGGKMELERTAIGLGAGGYKEVLGKAKGDEPNIAWGYEVRVDGEHVAWLIGKPKEGFVIAGVKAFDYKPTEHRVLAGALARLQAIIVPRYREAAKKAA